jgi:acetyl esterase/lipase
MRLMLRLLLLVCALGSVGPLSAAETRHRVLKDIAFLGSDRAEKLDVYLPAGETEGKRRPALVWIHGGGWTGGTKNEARAANVCGTAADAGYVAVSIDYRLGDGAWPTHLFDCKNAVRFLRANAAHYGVDPERIAVAGGSAGGHLALMVGLTTGKAGLEPEAPYPGISSAVRCVVNFYGIANQLTRQETAKDGTPTGKARTLAIAKRIFGASTDDAEVLRVASPVTHLSKSSPPILTFHGRADATVDYLQAEELDRVAKERGARHELRLIDGAGHTFDLQTWNKKPLPRDLRPEFLAFLREHLR